MIRASFLGHSGFLVETDSVSLLFDWWKGELPALRPEAPLLVFASHRHPDHFDPKIFTLDDGTRNISFFLGKGISPTAKRRKRPEVKAETLEKYVTLSGGQRRETAEGAVVEALSSTDEGAAFLVTVDGRTIFHAGDLNWWHWEGEDKAWNNNMAANFKRYTEPLRGRRIDLAMLPLDPRLGEAGFWGPNYFLELADIRAFLPMHQWEEFSFTAAFLEKHPEFGPKIVPVEKNGQVFTFED